MIAILLAGLLAAQDGTPSVTVNTATESTVRPIVPIPENLRADYLYQELVKEHAMRRQDAILIQINKYCSDIQATLQKTRNELGDEVLLCVPKGDKK
jgi:hypothetical protein